jgi:hypothetical protein
VMLIPKRSEVRIQIGAVECFVDLFLRSTFMREIGHLFSWAKIITVPSR